jgi:hypothetical protein
MVAGMMSCLPLLAAEPAPAATPKAAAAAKPASVAKPVPRKGRPARTLSATAKLNSIVVPEASFDRDMTFGEVVDWFRKASKKHDPAGKGIIFVIQDKPKKGETPLEELRLGSDFSINDQSLKQLLERVMTLYGWQILYSVDEFSVNFVRKP